MQGPTISGGHLFCGSFALLPGHTASAGTTSPRSSRLLLAREMRGFIVSPLFASRLGDRHAGNIAPGLWTSGRSHSSARAWGSNSSQARPALHGWPPRINTGFLKCWLSTGF
jgi:hypothetical protein